MTPAGSLSPRLKTLLLFLLCVAGALAGCSGREAPPLPTPLATVASLVPEPSVAAPSATPLPEPPATPTPEVITYVVVAGDTLGGIAKQFGTTVEALVTANILTNPDLLAIGDELVIPPSLPPTPTAEPSPTATPAPSG